MSTRQHSKIIVALVENIESVIKKKKNVSSRCIFNEEKTENQNKF